MDCKDKILELRESTGMNRREFCTFFQIPYRTVTEWELGHRHAPEYVLRLLEYYIQHENLTQQPTAESEDFLGKKHAPNATFILAYLRPSRWTVTALMHSVKSCANMPIMKIWSLLENILMKDFPVRTFKVGTNFNRCCEMCKTVKTAFLMFWYSNSPVLGAMRPMF